MTRPRRPAAAYRVVLGALVPLYLAVQLSNAGVPLSSVQHEGNFHDEARLSVEMERSPSLARALERLRWEPPNVAWAYLLHRTFGLGTTGRRVLSLLAACGSLVYLGVVLLRRRLTMPLGTVLCLVLSACSAVHAIYAPLGLTALSLLLLYSTFLLHLLIARYGRAVSWRESALLGVGLALLALHAIYAAVALCAVVVTLAVGEAVRWRGGGRAPARRLAPYAAMLAPLLLVAGAWSLLFPHEELGNPRRSHQLYFQLSDSAQTPLGLVEFAVRRSGAVAVAALEPNPVILGSSWPGRLLAVVAGVFLLVGVGRSLLRPRRRRFAIALSFLLTAAGHLLLSVLTLVPYGEMRYLLPLAVFFPVLAVLGLSDAATVARRRWRRRWRRRRTAPAWTAVALLGLPVLYLEQAVPWNLERARIVSQGFERLAAESSETPTALVLDRWTAVTVGDLQPTLRRTADHVLPLDRRAWERSGVSAPAAALARWRSFLAAQDQVYLVTSMPFDEVHYGELFALAKAGFEVQPLTRATTLETALLRRGGAGRDVLANGHLENARWTREEASVVELPDREYEVSLAPAGHLSRRFDLAVRPGDRLVASADLWSRRGGGWRRPELRLVVKRGDHGAYEGSIATLPLPSAPQPARVSHVFARPWESVVVSFVAPEGSPVTFFARDVDLRLVRAAGAAGGADQEAASPLSAPRSPRAVPRSRRAAAPSPRRAAPRRGSAPRPSRAA